VSEFDVQVSGEPIELGQWIKSGGCLSDSACAEIVIVPPTVAVGQGEVDSGRQVVCGSSGDAVHIQLAIENIIIDQVRIERELLGVLIPDVDLPIVFLLQLADTKPSCVRVALVAVARARRSYHVVMGVKHNCGIGAIVRFKISREIAEYPHRQLADFPADLHAQLENQQTVDPGLVLKRRRRVGHVWATALKVEVKCVAVTSVIVEDWRHLKVNVVRESKSSSHLPR